MNWETLLTAMLAFLGGSVIPPVIKYLTLRVQHDSAEAKALRQDTHLQTVETRRLEFEQQLQLMERLEARVDKMEAAHAECQRENATLREEVGRLREANVSLKEEVRRLREQVARLEADLGAYEDKHP